MKCKISWQNYIASILNKSHEIYDNLSFEKEEKLPSIIKASAYIQSKLKEHNKNAIFVVPECELSSCLFSVVNAISYILSGKNKGDITTIDDFEPNTKVRALGCTILFKGVEERDGIKRVRFAFKDEGSGFLALPDALPVFQKSEGKLSSFNNWEKHYAKWKASSNESIEPSLLARIKDKKSFLEGSVVYVGNLQNSRNILSNAYIKGQDLRDILIIKYLTKDGESKALKGVVSGVPSLLLVSNIDQIVDLINSNTKILGVVIDYSQNSASFIERLKHILRQDIPVTIFMNPADSIDNTSSLYESLGFKIWKWDKFGIIDKMYADTGYIEHAVANECNNSIQFIPCSAPEITEAFAIANKYKNLVDNEELPDQICSIYSDYVGFLYDLMRAISPINDAAYNSIKEQLECDSTVLKNSKISDEMISDMEKIAHIILAFAEKMAMAKSSYIGNTILQNKHNDLFVIVPPRANRQDITGYYKEFSLLRNIHPKVYLVSSKEFEKISQHSGDFTVVVSSWFDKKTMRELLFSYKFSDIRILLTEYEAKWAIAAIRFWNKELNDTCNKEIIDNYISNDTIEVDGGCFSGKDIFDQLPEFSIEKEEEIHPEDITDSDLSVIEQYFRNLKYRKYRANSSGNSSETIVDALPIEYVDNNISFFIPDHELIVCETNDDDIIRVVKKSAQDLSVGDAVALRKDDNDLIRAVADIALKEQNAESARESAAYFQNFLMRKVGNVASFHRKLIDSGYGISYAAVLSWVNNDDFIGVQDKAALYAVANILNSDFLKENADRIFDAAETVKNAHRSAGKALSKLLNDYLQKQKLERIPLTMTTQEFGEIEFHVVDNIGEPIKIERSRLNHIRIKDV